MTEIVGYLRIITTRPADHGLTFGFIRDIITIHRHGAIPTQGIRLIVVIPHTRLIRDTPHSSFVPPECAPHSAHRGHSSHQSHRLIGRVLQVLNVGIIPRHKFTS